MSESQEVTGYDFANTSFARKMYNELKKTDGNVFFSPYSLQVVLAMTYAGAGGNTAKELQKHLAFPDDVKALEKAVHNSMNVLKKAKSVTMNMANGMFVQKDYTVKPTFSKTIVDSFKSEVKQLDFADSPASASVINSYVKKNTNDKIPQLFDQSAFSAMTKLVLVNAIYFKGAWVHKFDPKDTQKGDFHVSANKTVQVDFMKINKKYNYTFNDELNASVVELKYEGDMSMVLVVPKEIEGLKKVEEKLVAMDLNQLTSDAYPKELNLSMPKFKLEQTLELGNTLKKVGLTDMFDASKADFSGITDNRELYVSDAVQKAYIEVNEEGAEAAAATGFQLNMRMMPVPPEDVEVDRPFMFFLRNYDNTVLFVGRVNQP